MNKKLILILMSICFIPLLSFAALPGLHVSNQSHFNPINVHCKTAGKDITTDLYMPWVAIHSIIGGQEGDCTFSFQGTPLARAHVVLNSATVPTQGKVSSVTPIDSRITVTLSATNQFVRDLYATVH